MKGFSKFAVAKMDNGGYAVREDVFLGLTVAAVCNPNLTDDTQKKIAAALNSED